MRRTWNVRRVTTMAAVTLVMGLVAMLPRRTEASAIDTIEPPGGRECSQQVNIGRVTIFAGSGTPGSGRGGYGATTFNNPRALASGTLADDPYLVLWDETSTQLVKISGFRTGAPTTAMLATSVNAFAGLVTVGFGGGVFYHVGNTHVVASVDVSTGSSSVLAGASGSTGSTDATGGAARFHNPTGLGYDGALHALVVIESGGHTMRQVDVATAAVTTVAGSYGDAQNIDGAAIATARLAQPKGNVAVHPQQRDRYFMTAGSCAVRVLRVSASPTVETVAGDHAACSLLDGVGLAARFTGTLGVWTSPDGKALYVSDSTSHVIRRVVTQGYIVTTVLGSGANAVTMNDDPLLSAFAIAIASVPDLDGTRLYVGMNHAVASVRLNDDCGPRVVTVPAGVTTSMSAADRLPAEVLYDPTTAAWYVAQYDLDKIRKSTDKGETFSDWVGDGTNAFLAGSGTSGRLPRPFGLALSRDGTVMYVGGVSEHRILQVVVSTATLSVLAGQASSGFGDGAIGGAQFNTPIAFAVDPATGDLIVADQGNQRIRSIDEASTTVSTVAGSGTEGTSDNANPLLATLKSPRGIAIHPRSRHRFVLGLIAHNIRSFGVTGGVDTVAGSTSATSGYDDNFGTLARFNVLQLCAWDTNDQFRSLLVVDQANQRIRRFDVTTTYVSTVFGTGTPGIVGNADPLLAQLNDPTSVGFGEGGTVMLIVVAHGVVRVERDDALCPAAVADAKGATYLLVGSAASGTADGSGAATGLDTPTAVAGDLAAADAAYVADSANHVVRKVSGGTTTAVVAGTVGSTATLSTPSGVCVSSDGAAVYVADTGHHAVQRLKAATLSVLAGTSGTAGHADAATGVSATFTSPRGLAMWRATEIMYVGQARTIRAVFAATGETKTQAGQSGSASTAVVDGAFGANVVDASAGGLAVRQATGEAYFTHGGTAVRVVGATSKVVTTLAGAGTSGFADGAGSTARFSGADGVAVSACELELYVADTGNHRVRRVNVRTLVVDTIAGDGGSGSIAAGGARAALARLPSPRGVGVSADGATLFVACDHAVVSVALVGSVTGSASASASATIPATATATRPGTPSTSLSRTRSPLPTPSPTATGSGSRPSLSATRSSSLSVPPTPTGTSTPSQTPSFSASSTLVKVAPPEVRIVVNTSITSFDLTQTSGGRQRVTLSGARGSLRVTLVAQHANRSTFDPRGRPDGWVATTRVSQPDGSVFVAPPLPGTAFPASLVIPGPFASGVYSVSVVVDFAQTREQRAAAGLVISVPSSGGVPTSVAIFRAPTSVLDRDVATIAVGVVDPAGELARGENIGSRYSGRSVTLLREDATPGAAATANLSWSAPLGADATALFTVPVLTVGELNAAPFSDGRLFRWHVSPSPAVGLPPADPWPTRVLSNCSGPSVHERAAPRYVRLSEWDARAYIEVPLAVPDAPRGTVQAIAFPSDAVTCTAGSITVAATARSGSCAVLCEFPRLALLFDDNATLAEELSHVTVTAAVSMEGIVATALRSVPVVSSPLRLSAMRERPRTLVRAGLSPELEPECFRMQLLDGRGIAAPLSLLRQPAAAAANDTQFLVAAAGQSVTLDTTAAAAATSVGTICGVNTTVATPDAATTTATTTVAFPQSPLSARVPRDVGLGGSRVWPAHGLNVTAAVTMVPVRRFVSRCVAPALTNVSVVGATSPTSNCKRHPGEPRRLTGCAEELTVVVGVNPVAARPVAIEVGTAACAGPHIVNDPHGRRRWNATGAGAHDHVFEFAAADCGWDGAYLRSDNGTEPRVVSALLDDGRIATDGDAAPLDVRFEQDDEEPGVVTVKPQPPVLYGISGCFLQAYPSAAECSPGKAMTLTIFGANFGNVTAVTDAALHPHNWFPVPCTTATVTSDTTIECPIAAGTGFGQNAAFNATLAVLGTAAPLNVSTLRNQAFAHFVPGNEALCRLNPTTAQLCSGGDRGVCSGQTGSCECVGDPANATSAAETGVFFGSACDQCHPAYAGNATLPTGQACTKPCPGVVGGPASAIVCSGHGQCSEGACVRCTAGWGGSACESECPTSNGGQPCGGPSNGVCQRSDGTCACHFSASQGFFTGAGCGACDPLYSGVRCDQPCPLLSGVVCGGNGACRDGACVCNAGRCGSVCETVGAACDSCPTGFWGLACSDACNGGSSTPCSGHGVCNGGKSGDGTCICDRGYAGRDCGQLCPGGAGAPCSNHGTCSAVDGTCACDSFYATTACAVQCPGVNAARTSACSGHGSCSQGSRGFGTCVCDPGYTSSDCSVACPGGAASPCSLHGLCLSNGTCACYASQPTGFWTGEACGACAYGFAGSKCDERCAVAASNGKPCGGRGACTAGPQCKCFTDAVNGHWTGATCEECLPGYWGANCTAECPGSACLPCNGHGTCSDGTTGNGTCGCTQSAGAGVWAGAACDGCASSYFGEQCRGRCPGGTADCGGYGTCDDGLTGTGRCSCQANRALSNATQLCTDCASGFFGPQCAPCGVPVTLHELVLNGTAITAADTSALGLTATDAASCSGRGTCSDGLLGDGTCSCDEALGASGHRCELVCPAPNATICGGHGTCTAAGCVCSAGWTLDDATNACVLCAAGYFGGDCSGVCPECSGSTCNDGLGGDGTCSCLSGYWGAACDEVCPGGVANPCSGHGQCRQSDGVCVCDRDPTTTGVYTGARCDACDPLWLSARCNVGCPTFDGVVCSGRSACMEGACVDCQPRFDDTTFAACGASCQLLGRSCIDSANACDQGFWGAACDQLCPGTSADVSVVCSGHGFCNADIGTCLCANGYGGAACDSQCPSVVDAQGRSLICSGRGNCAGARCDCLHGYWGDDCGNECPGGRANTCGGNGRCNQTDGTCTCVAGMAGPGCTVPCAGGRYTPCSGHGECSADDGSCTCAATSQLGFFDGDDCAACADGFGAGTCRSRCDTQYGATLGTECACVAGHAGPTCAISCPTALIVDSDGTAGHLVCAGHGTCDDGASGDGTCRCDREYYGGDCTVRCSPAICLAGFGFVHSQCGAANGTCECQCDGQGCYTGAACNDCVSGFWGTQCSLACACNGRGSCDRVSGECSCFQSEATGYWGGQYCAVCATGYIGLSCRSKNVELSENANATVAYSVAAASASTAAPIAPYDDTEHGLRYLGTAPVIIVRIAAPDVNSTTAMQPLGTVEPSTAGARVLGVSGLNATHLLVTLSSPAPSSSVASAVIRRNATGTVAPAVITAYTSTSAAAEVQSRRHGTYERRLLQSATAAPAATADPSAVFTVADTSSTGVVVRAFADGTIIATTPTASAELVLRALLSDVASAAVDASASPGFATVTGTAAPLSNSSDASVSFGTWRAVVLDLTAVAAALQDAPAGSSATTAMPNACYWWTDAAASATPETAAWAAAAQTNEYPCSAFAPCSAARCVFNVLRLELACVLTHTSGAALAVFSQLAGFGGSGSAAMVAERFVVARAFDVTAVGSDNEYGLFFAAINEPLLPSTLYKFRGSDAVLTGVVGFKSLGAGDNEIVRALAVDSVRRVLTVTIVTSVGFEQRSLNLFGIKAITPSVVDATGGTPLTIAGEGFSRFSPPYCRVTATVSVPATFVDNETVVCAAPAASSTGGQCETLLFNVAFGDRSTTASNVPYQRPASAVPSLVTAQSSGRWYSSQGAVDTLLLTGTGFVSSPWAECAVFAGPRGTLHARLGAAEFVNTTAVRCRVAATVAATLPPAAVAYSHDGHVFSPVRAAYAVVGEPNGLTVASPAAGTVVVSASTVRIPTVTVRVVDRDGNALYAFDPQTAARTIVATIQRPLDGSAVPAWANASVTTAPTSDGEVAFASLFVLTPRAGALTQEFAERKTRWSATLELRVVVGRPSQLQLDSSNGTAASSAWRFGYNDNAKLAPAPEIIVTDAAGNRVTNAADLPVAVTLQYRTVAPGRTDGPTATTLGAVATSARYTFVDPPARGLHNVANELRFSAVNAPSIAPLVVSRILTASCAAAEYAVSETTQCLPCPANAVCDGTSDLAAVDGYWRSSADSVVFYSCKPPHSADSCGKGACKEGYEGTRCSVCKEGYGKTGLACQRCQDAAVSWLLIALLALVSFSVLLFFVINSITAGTTALPGQKKDILPIVVKMLLNHFQTMAIVGLSDASAPSVLTDFFRGQQTASSFNPNLSFASCEAMPDYRARFIITALSPYVLFAAFAIVLGVRLLKQRFGSKDAADVDLFEDNAFYAVEAERNRHELFNELDADGGGGGAGIISANHGVSMRDEYAPPARPPTGTALDAYFPRDKYPPSARASRMAELPPDAKTIPQVNDDDSAAPFDPVAELMASDIDALYYPSNPDTDFASTNRSENETLAERSLRKSLLLQWFDLVAVTFVIVLHMLYPTILEVSGNLLVCEDIDMGAGNPPRSVLVADRSIDCNSDAYAELRAAAYAHLIGYGAGLPLLMVLMVKLVASVSMGGDVEDSKRLFFFITGGFAETRWFWESVVLARKAAVVVIAVSVSDPKMRAYAGMWTMTAAFLLNAIVLPYSDKLLYRLETASLLSIAVTLNLMLLFGFYDAESTPGPYYGALVAVFVVQIAVMLAFVFGVAFASREKVAKLAQQHPKLFGWAERVLQGDPLAQAVERTQRLQDEVAAMHARIVSNAPRVAAISEFLALNQPATLPTSAAAQHFVSVRRDYDACVAMAPHRLLRYADEPEEVYRVFALEQEILRAELDRLREVRRERFAQALRLEAERRADKARSFGVGIAALASVSRKPKE